MLLFLTDPDAGMAVLFEPLGPTQMTVPCCARCAHAGWQHLFLAGEGVLVLRLLLLLLHAAVFVRARKCCLCAASTVCLFRAW